MLDQTVSTTSSIGDALLPHVHIVTSPSQRTTREFWLLRHPVLSPDPEGGKELRKALSQALSERLLAMPARTWIAFRFRVDFDERTGSYIVWLSLAKPGNWRFIQQQLLAALQEQFGTVELEIQHAIVESLTRPLPCPRRATTAA